MLTKPGPILLGAKIVSPHGKAGPEPFFKKHLLYSEALPKAISSSFIVRFFGKEVQGVLMR